jgi:hypothetical protein
MGSSFPHSHLLARGIKEKTLGNLKEKPGKMEKKIPALIVVLLKRTNPPLLKEIFHAFIIVVGVDL